ncbi:hypothetical protein SELMODRAFT_422042 [Selaginella moellendorffii]|uniref:Uncharacterized protein n=1 Tax=Selaginella moellendorffii TaxID=88036 RepID=D8SH59_SELML|nr:hypothetical protein SELMODRAFT_422042 [Selaginella moellendorffii]
MPQRKRRGQPQWSRSLGKGSHLDRCGLGRLSGYSSQVSNEVSASHAGGNNEHNNDVDVEMNTQIDVGVIEAVGTGAPEATGISGGVLAFDVGGGGGVVPSIAEAARGEGELVVVRDYACMILTRGKKLGMYELEFYCPCTHERELCPWYLELVEQMPTSDFELDLYLECHPDVAKSSHQFFRQTKTFFPSLSMAIDDNLEELSSAVMHKQVRPLSPMASVGIQGRDLARSLMSASAPRVQSTTSITPSHVYKDNGTLAHTSQASCL